jgi:hypothetical protein
MIKEPCVEYSDHKSAKLSVGVVHDPWGITDGDPVPTFVRICVGDPAGRETDFLVSRDAAPKLIKAIEDALRTLVQR